ncbi:MAG: M15 family metallopeptidase [Candidatus Babeliaceae bacterium]
MCNVIRLYFMFVIVSFFTTIFSMQNTLHDLVNIEEINSRIRLDIRYATKNNFTHQVLYSSPKAYLRKGVAHQLSNVQEELETFGFGLKIWDAYRPHAVQYILWNLVPNKCFVADPKKGSRHNRGAAVDVTLVDIDGNELEMPRVLDDFTEKAGRISVQQIENSQLLEDIMKRHGFIGSPTKWCHFYAKGWEQYDLLDIPFEQLP